jgi:hypothetical protein
MSLEIFSAEEHQRLVDAKSRYGNAFANAYNTTILLSNLMMWPVIDCDLFIRFYSQAMLGRQKDYGEFLPSSDTGDLRQLIADNEAVLRELRKEEIITRSTDANHSIGDAGSWPRRQDCRRRRDDRLSPPT